MAMTFKAIKAECERRNIQYHLSENGQYIWIPACEFHKDNYYGYSDPYKTPQCEKDSFLLMLFHDNRIHVTICSECCNCGDW